jgi:hypothetical protein
MNEKPGLEPGFFLTRRTSWARSLRLLHELRFQIHRADAVDLAGDVVAIGRLGQADVPDLGSTFDDR